MQKNIKLGNATVPYQLRRSRRSRRLRVSINCDSAIVVSAPPWLPNYFIERFLQRKAEWIIAKLNYFKRFDAIHILPRGRKAFEEYRAQARVIVHTKIAEFNSVYQFTFNRVSIKNSRTRWGSCSQKGNLNFSYRLALVPERLAEYVVAHELSHLSEMNHSKKFWKVVAQTIPDYKLRIKELRSFAR